MTGLDLGELEGVKGLEGTPTKKRVGRVSLRVQLNSERLSASSERDQDAITGTTTSSALHTVDVGWIGEDDRMFY